MSNQNRIRVHKIFMDGFLATFADRPTTPLSDWRLATEGSVIHGDNYYVDEPFIIKADDGAWVCSLSVGDWQESDPSQRTIVKRSTDFGKTWSDPVDIEPAEGPEGSKAVLLKADSGRIYAFYIYNTDNLREIAGDNPPYETGICKRVDSLGDFVFRFSDDHGVTWSPKRYVIPMRLFDIDRENPYKGKIKFGMNSAIPFVQNGRAYVPFTKVGHFGEGLFARSEGVVFCSANLMRESDPEKITWETLPDGDVGLRAPDGGGPIAEEHSFCVLSDGTIHCVYRTIDGWPVVSYSRDGGHTWTTPEYMRYSNGQKVKCPRAANFVWKCNNGKYLYWYHNHGGPSLPAGIERNSHYSFENRNPVWLCGGREIDSVSGRVLEWSQPEIIMYEDDPIVRMSYPDLIEDDERYFITETNKDIARIHEIDHGLIDGLWKQLEGSDNVPQEGLVFEEETESSITGEYELPRLPDFTVLDHSKASYPTKQLRRGFTLDFRIVFESLNPGQVIIDTRNKAGEGLLVRTVNDGAIEFLMRDGFTANLWDSDPGRLSANTNQHISIIVDGGPRIISFVINGSVCDGGDHRQFGWGRFSPHLRTPYSGRFLRIGESSSASVKKLLIYDRPLRVSEAISIWMAESE